MNRLTITQRRLYSAFRYGGGSYGSPSTSFFQNDQNRLPVNTIIKFVPQQQAWVVERFGKFHRILEPGLAILLPLIDQIRYVKTLKEVAVEIPSQSAITQDNVTINMDGVLYYRVIDPFKVYFVIFPITILIRIVHTLLGLLWSRRRRLCHHPIGPNHDALRNRQTHPGQNPGRTQPAQCEHCGGHQ